MTRWILLAVGLVALLAGGAVPYALLGNTLTVDPSDSFTADGLTVTVGEKAGELAPVSDGTTTWRIDPRTARTDDGTLTYFFPAGTTEQTYPVQGHPADFTGESTMGALQTFIFTGDGTEYTVAPRTGHLLNMKTPTGEWSPATQAARLEVALAAYRQVRLTDWVTFLLRTFGGALIIVAVVLWLRARV